ncbi:RNA 2',3'-cyclic phosphodiesterase [Roseivivax sp. THAF30]|uniref:RNA 2',3'-cyclic phosphodiesterase n=1 Tax=Roseivivax sp. THAF30 TaxID=2587852 RepID=UPI0012688878|nr:RNA 2',3'-cyclic phosphodiesterase [Roseivivax sp. THAF30]QFT62350.1 2',5' RNA ligase family [Roseivivax sp. THAF30]
MRAFLALPLPASDAEVLEAMGDRLGFGSVVPAENMHLTLAFLGEVEEPLLREAADALETLQPPAFSFRLSGLSTYGTALALDADGGAALSDLQARVKSRLTGAGLVLERRRFRPHVTFARLPERRTPEEERKFAAFLADESTMRIDEVPAREFVLYESILTKSGAVHEPLAEFELA